MTFYELKRRVGKTKNTILIIIKGKNIGGRGHMTQKQLLDSEDYTEYDIEQVTELLSWKKKDYIQEIRRFLSENPFSTLEDVTTFLARPSSYTVWIITEMSFSEADLAETDDGLLFLVNDETTKRVMGVDSDRPFQLRS